MSTGEVRELPMSIPDPLDVSARLGELRSLKDGWLEGQGLHRRTRDWTGSHGPSRGTIPKTCRSRTCIRQKREAFRPSGRLVPKEVSLEIELRSHAGEWHVLDMETDAVSERTLNIDNANDWKWLVEQIRQMNKEVEDSDVEVTV